MDQGIEVGVTVHAVEAALHLGESIGDPPVPVRLKTAVALALVPMLPVVLIEIPLRDVLARLAAVIG